MDIFGFSVKDDIKVNDRVICSNSRTGVVQAISEVGNPFGFKPACLYLVLFNDGSSKEYSRQDIKLA